MFITEYCDNPDRIDQLSKAPVEHKDTIFNEYKRRLRTLDKIVYLDDTFTITLEAGEKLISGMPQGIIAFWEINRCLLNYVNAVYCLHEFINGYRTVVKSTTDIFWKMRNQRFWYRFMCEYRDCVVHQSIRIKDYFPMNGDIVICIDDLIEELAWIINDKEQAKFHNKVSQFKSIVESLDQKLSPIQHRGCRYCSMKEIIIHTTKEITDLYNAILPQICKAIIFPEIEWFLSLVHYEQGIAKYTFIVNKDKYDSELEPNYSIEQYFKNLLQQFGKDHTVCKGMKQLLESKGYTHFYDGNCEMEAFVDRWSLPQDRVSSYS